MLAPGAQVAGYRITGLLGQGGMGFVYEAEHAVLGRKAALKTLLPELVDDAEFRTRFIAESQTVAALDHPSIIPIYDAGEADGVVYIAMRHVGGGDLHQLLESGHCHRCERSTQSSSGRSYASPRPRARRTIEPPRPKQRRSGSSPGERTPS